MANSVLDKQPTHQGQSVQEQGLGAIVKRPVMPRWPMLCITTIQAPGSTPSALPLLSVEYAAVTSLSRLEISISSNTCRIIPRLCYAAWSGFIRHAVPYTTRKAKVVYEYATTTHHPHGRGSAIGPERVLRRWIQLYFQ
jgi:hypothetical protein